MLLDTETGRIIVVKYSTGICVIVEALGDRVEVVTVLVTSSLERLAGPEKEPREVGPVAEERRARVIEYDPEADVLTVNLRPGRRIAEDRLLDNDVVVSVDEKGEPVQVQVLDASKRGLVEALLELHQARKALLQLLTGRSTAGPAERQQAPESP